jgi:hypothetical protein
MTSQLLSVRVDSSAQVETTCLAQILRARRPGFGREFQQRQDNGLKSKN